MKPLLALLVVLAAPAAANPLQDFQTRARPELLAPFARDLGGVLGGASAHTGRTIGFPGFWAGAVASVQTRPEKDNLILRSAGVKAFGLPMLEAGVGLPFKVDLVVHGLKAYGATVVGGGVRYGVYRTDLVDTFLPNISVSAFGDKVTHDAFSATHGALNAAATWNLPIVKPFFLAGYDLTEVKVERATAAGTLGAKATGRGSRFSVGAGLTPFPFLDFRAAYTLRHGIPGFDLGLGAKF
ncbi:MAG: hypothetical protein SF051_02965 [Elusimicrobiota bacterium]|nr:hypothetical protein [Elusimicrobiota bacterium]